MPSGFRFISKTLDRTGSNLVAVPYELLVVVVALDLIE